MEYAQYHCKTHKKKKEKDHFKREPQTQEQPFLNPLYQTFSTGMYREKGEID